MIIDLKGRVAIVTGAGRGIGRVISATLAAEGVKTIVTDVDAAALEDVGAEFQQNGWEGRQYECDVRDFASIQRVVADVEDTYGRLDILVNNAGVLRSGSVEQLSEEDWDLSSDINLKGVFLMSKAVIPVMKKQRSGRIINASSFAVSISQEFGATRARVKLVEFQTETPPRFLTQRRDH